MSIATGTSPIQPEPGLLGQTVVVIGGSAGIGLETARRARAETDSIHPSQNGTHMMFPSLLAVFAGRADAASMIVGIVQMDEGRTSTRTTKHILIQLPLPLQIDFSLTCVPVFRRFRDAGIRGL